MRPVCHSLGHVFGVFFTSTKSNDITNTFVKSILVQKSAYTSIYDIIMSPEHIEIKNKELCPFLRLQIDSYQLCLKILTIVPFGSEQ